MTEETNNMPQSMIHPTAIIDPQAKIGAGVKIGPYAVIGPHVTIGDGTEIMAHVTIDGWTTIGKDCRFFPSCSIGSEPQDLKYHGEKSYLIIGDRSVFREFVTVSTATGEGEETRIGNDCLFQACTHVAHNCVVGNHVIMSNCAGLAGHVTVEDRVVIGGIAGVHCENAGVIDALIEQHKAAGDVGPSAHPRCRPNPLEAEAVAHLLRIAEVADVPVVIVHLSTKESLAPLSSASRL